MQAFGCASDAANFADVSANEAALTLETLVSPPANSAIGIKIMHFLMANSATPIPEAQAGWLDAHDHACGLSSNVAASLQYWIDACA